MRCKRCWRTFRADWRIADPLGRAVSPLYALFLGVILLVASIAGLQLQLPLGLKLALLVFSVTMILVAPWNRARCERSGGGTCPHCKYSNRVRLWSY